MQESDLQLTGISGGISAGDITLDDKVTAKSNAEQIIDEYLEGEAPIAFEFTVPQDTISIVKQFGKYRKAGSSVWVNSLWPQHNGGHDDEKAALAIKYDEDVKGYANFGNKINK